MTISATFGGLPCPNCKALLHYGGVTDIPLYLAKCEACGAEWHVINHPDGRTEVRPKQVS